jgi:hypothetical protein
MVDSETTIKKYDNLKISDIAKLLDTGLEMKIEYIAQSGYWGRTDSENQPIKEPFGIIEFGENSGHTVIKLNPNELVELINYLVKRK